MVAIAIVLHLPDWQVRTIGFTAAVVMVSRLPYADVPRFFLTRRWPWVAVLIPVLAVAIDPLILLAYLIDAPVVMVPVIWQAVERRETGRALLSLPGFFVLRVVNGAFMLRAFWNEMVVGRPLRVYEKGH